MFEKMENAETTYEGVVEHFYKRKTNTIDVTCAVISIKIRVGSASPNSSSDMGGFSIKNNQIYVGFLRYKSKLTCPFHGNVSHFSEKCRFLSNFIIIYAVGRHLKIVYMNLLLRKMW